MEDPVAIFQSVVDLAKERRRLASLLAGVRQLHETDEQTLDRLIRERAALVKILQNCPASTNDHAAFDKDYSQNLFVLLGRYVEPAMQGWWRFPNLHTEKWG